MTKYRAQRWVGAIALSLLIAMPLCADTPTRHSSKRKTKQAAPAPVPPPAPIVPLQPISLDQLPATPPHVTFSNGQLSILAQNSTLGEILRAVKAQTGAVVEMPGNPIDRVVGRLGPGPARDVLASLLNGTRFNYVLLGSATNPQSLGHIILIAKTGGGAEPAAQVAQAYNPPPEAAPAGGAPLPATQAGNNPDAEEQDDADSADQNGNGDDQADQADQADQNQQNQQNQAKTPEQLLQELQRQQQIQQQLGQQPGGPGGPRFPGLPQQPAGQQPEQ